jgi:hypothetical protein
MPLPERTAMGFSKLKISVLLLMKNILCQINSNRISLVHGHAPYGFELTLLILAIMSRA